VFEVSAERFDQMVADAIDSLPDDLRSATDNVVVLVAERAPHDNLYGLYEGIPLTRRNSGYMLALPDRITIFKGTICDRCNSEAEVADRVRITVIHEFAHHFGIGDARLVELGWV
jgi:predicted Zn-dependent protease with MMP-like domain